MSTLFAVRVPYPRMISRTKNFPDPVYLFFIDTSDMREQSFFDFYRRLRTGAQFLNRMRDERGGNLYLLFGESFEDAIKSILIEEDADTLVTPVEERGTVSEALCKVVYL